MRPAFKSGRLLQAHELADTEQAEVGPYQQAEHGPDEVVGVFPG